MKTFYKLAGITLSLLICVLLLSSFLKRMHSVNYTSFKFPYRHAGLTERQAAAHLLNRFTYGATPAQIDQVVNMGLENWFKQQLQADMPDDSLEAMLSKRLDAIKLSNAEVAAVFPKPGEVLRLAIKDGVINKDSVQKNTKAYQADIQNYMQQHGMKPERELFRQFIVQKILRAAYTNNQLQEVMTSFWFNHFNVSITKNDCAQFIPAYERDVIRPNALGKFSDLLLATAKSPAMLYYLDNFSSTGANANLPAKRLPVKQYDKQMTGDTALSGRLLKKLQQAKKSQGLNENYAREVMELHTLGVDGGYNQQDVTQAARVLTGWTIYPLGNTPQSMQAKKLIELGGGDQKLAEHGFVHDGDFFFTANRHDNGEKTVLGQKFGPNGGYQEGVQLLTLLAHHPSTAKFICHKIAVRFVNDNPPQSLIDKMAKTFLNKDGDIKQVLVTMVSSPEFWSTSTIREKTKSPFELAINAVRALHADLQQPYQLFTWMDRMGEKIYFYQAPTGFPDKAQYWINTGALLNRMNFGLALASNRIQGIHVDLAALNNHHEPESAQAALVTYAGLIMPERNMEATIKQLTPILNDPLLMKKVNDAASKTTLKTTDTDPAEPVIDNMAMSEKNVNPKRKIIKNSPNVRGDNTMLAQVVGVVIGSPEFQRR